MASVPRIESPGHRLESLGTPHLKLSDAEEENLEEAAALFSLLGVQAQVLGSSLLARRTAAVAATGPRGQLAAVLIRLTSDTCVQPRPRTGIRVIGHLLGSADLQKLDSVIGPAWDRGLRPLDRPWKICSSSSSRSPARPVPVLGNRATVSELPLQLGTARRRPLTRARG